MQGWPEYLLVPGLFIRPAAERTRLPVPLWVLEHRRDRRERARLRLKAGAIAVGALTVIGQVVSAVWGGRCG